MAFSGRMACCIINAPALNSQQENSADTPLFKDKQYRRHKVGEGVNVEEWYVYICMLVIKSEEKNLMMQSSMRMAEIWSLKK